MDQRLELRLRNDPTLDPLHVPGGFRDRTAAAAVRRQRARPAIVATARPASALLGVLLFLASVLVIRTVTAPGTTPPPATTSPIPSATPVPTMDAGRVRQVVDGWVARFGGSVPPISITVIGPGGVSSTWSEGLPDGPIATVRIGEISRLYLSVGAVMIDACSRVDSQWSCPRPYAFGTEFSFDDAVAEWYEPWPDGDVTTIGQLLEGSSGLAPTGASVADLAEQIAAEPATDWTRDAVIARALAAPRSFVPGSRRAPTDTEGFVLEEALEAATGLPSSQIISGGGATRFHDQVDPDGLIPGVLPSGDPVGDLDPVVLELVGNAGGMTASSQDLADITITIWATQFSLSRETLDYLTDAPGGYTNPIAARGICCRDSSITTIAATGHAAGWSAMMAYDFETGVSVGAVMGRDLSEADLQSLLDAINDESTGVVSG